MRLEDGKKAVLAIETSCDETAAAVVTSGGDVLSNIVASQVKWHEAFKGVVPEIASRKHLELVNSVIDRALGESGLTLEELDALAVTRGPGLVGSLMVGVASAKALAFASRKPLAGVDHIEGHIFGVLLEHPELAPPFVALVVSGGHTSLFLVQELGRYRLLGETRDDAAGEAFDKSAAYLDLGYPGGPVIDRLAASGNRDAIRFPRGMRDADSLDFSFSGLKTSVIYRVAGMRREGRPVNKADLAASFQAAVVDVLVDRAAEAVKLTGVERLAVAGGVAANRELRRLLEKAAELKGFEVFFPSLPLTTDNAAMIAWAGHHRLQKGQLSGLALVPDPNLKLGERDA